MVVYGRIAAAANPLPSVLCGWTAFLLGVAGLSLIQPPPELSLVLVAACFALGLRLLPPVPSPPFAAAAPPWWDLPARALSALVLVLTLTAVSGALGPHLSGLLAPFPVITSILAVFTHAHGGFAQVNVLLRNFLLGFYGFAAFCFVLAVALPLMTSAAAFGLATAAALAAQATTFFLAHASPAGDLDYLEQTPTVGIGLPLPSGDASGCRGLRRVSQIHRRVSQRRDKESVRRDMLGSQGEPPR